MKSVHISGNDIEEITSTYSLNACNKTLIKTSEFILEQVWLALSKHHLIITIVNKVNIFNMLSKNTSVLNLNLFWIQVFSLHILLFINVSAYFDKESSKTNILE